MFQKKVRKALISIVGGILVIAALTGCGSSKKLTGKTAGEITEMMGVGINIGNTFDATGGNPKDVMSFERSWGNPNVTKEFIKGCKDAGFDTIRIPTTWYRAFTDEKSFTISEEYLARVKQVIDWCYEYDMFVILNIHHEEWLNCEELVTGKSGIMTELICVWEQLAEYYGDYDQHLIFEGMNEPRLVYSNGNADWNGNQKAYDVINEFNQAFVDTVRRSDKKNNAERCLMIPGYAASCSTSVMKSIKIPQINGEDAKNIIISVHSYTPYNLCLSDKESKLTASSKKDIDGVFNAIKSTFLSKGIPVVIGETSITNTGDNTSERAAWAEYTAAKAASLGLPIVVWDNGNDKKSGGECHAWMNRRTNVPCYQEVVDALIKGKNSVKWGSSR